MAGASSLLRRRCSSMAKLTQARLREYRLEAEAHCERRDARAEVCDSDMLYRHLRHMEEANAWSEELGLAVQYRPHARAPRRGGGVPGKEEVVCHVYEDGGFAKEVTLELFEKRYRSLQSRWVQLSLAKEKRDRAALTWSEVDDKSLCARASRGGGAALRPPTLLGREEQDALQREIRRVTLETLALSDMMRQQLEVLEAKPAPPSSLLAAP